MPRIQFASGRSQLCALTLDTISGSLAADTYYFYLSGRNDAGYSLPGPVASVTTNGSQGIELVIPGAAYIEGENWLEYVISINTVDDPTTAKALLSLKRSDLTLPYIINLTLPAHVQTERQLAAFPNTDLLNGLIVTRTSDGLIYRYNSFSSQWERYYDGYNVAVISDTTDELLGCDTPISLIDESRYIINYDYALDDTEGNSRRYWIFNDLTTPIPAGREIGLTTTIQDQDVSSLFYNLFKVVFEGYFDQTTEEFITLQDGVAEFSYLGIEELYTSSMDNLILERDLATNQAFQIRIFPEFDVSELGLGLNLLPVDSNVSVLPFLKPDQGKETDLGELLGDVIIGTDPNLRRVYPAVGLSAFVDSGISVIAGRIKNTKTPTTALGLSNNIENQILAINSAGNVYPVSSLRVNERQRALVSTASGESVASTFSSEIEGDNNPNITVTVDYPTIIRASYPDVIAGSNKGVFNAEEIVLYVRKRNSEGGSIVETRRFTGLAPTNTTSDDFSVLYENGTVYAGSIPSTQFGLWSPANLTPTDIIVENTTGTFYYDFAVSFKYNGGTITDISHSVLDGCVEELRQSLGEITSTSQYWQSPQFDPTSLSNISSNLLIQGATYPVLEDTNGDISLYTYNSAETTAADGFDYLAVTNGPGRFVRVRGTDGTNGSSGFGLFYNFSTLTSTPPLDGEVRFSSSTYSSVTSIYVSETDRNSISISNLLSQINNNSVLVFIDANDPTKYAYYTLTSQLDSGSYKTYTVSHIVSNGPLSGEITLAFALKGDTGATGATGATGDIGPQGNPGLDGVSGFGIRFVFSAITTGPPSSGEVRINNATYASATSLFISETDRFFGNVSAILDLISPGSPLLLIDEADPAVYAYYELTSQTDNGTDRTFAVSHVASSGTFSGNVSLTFSARGEQGVAGNDGVDGATGSVSAASALTLQGQAAITSTGADEIDVVNVNNQLRARLESDGAELVFAFLELAQSFTKAQRVTPVALSISSGVVNIDASLSNIYTLTLNANVTSVTISNLTAGTNFDLHITQDATGGRTMTGWNSAFDWAGGTAPTITSAATAKDFISFESADGSTIKGFWAGNFS